MKLNLGCQEDVRKGYINLDKWDYKGVNVVWDLEETPLPFETSSFSEVVASNILEHMDKLMPLMRELHRITEPNGIIKITVPFYNSPYAVGSLDHKRFFEHNSYQNFTNKFYFNGDERYKFELVRKSIKPTTIGKLIVSDWLLINLSYFIGNLINELYFELRIIKKKGR